MSWLPLATASATSVGKSGVIRDADGLKDLIRQIVRLEGINKRVRFSNMATAAKLTIAQVSEIVELGELDPEAIVTTPMSDEEENGSEIEQWRKFPSLRATAGNNLILIDSKSIGRHSPSVLDGAALLCV